MTFFIINFLIKKLFYIYKIFNNHFLTGLINVELFFFCSLRTERPSGLETGRVRRELSRALAIWSKHSKLTFQEINSDKADILIFFHR